MTDAHAALAAVQQLRNAKVREAGQPTLSHVLDEVESALRETLAALAERDAGDQRRSEEGRTDWDYEQKIKRAEAALADASARIPAALEEAWDQGNATGLDGWVGPGRGTEPVDQEAIVARRRDVEKLLAQFDAPAADAYPEPPNECAHCGKRFDFGGSLTRDGATFPLCHPNDGLDCYRLVTVYGETVGARRPEPSRPQDNAEDTRDKIAKAITLAHLGLLRDEATAGAIADAGRRAAEAILDEFNVTLKTAATREALAQAIARAMPGWNEDTSEPLHPGYSEAARRQLELHWIRVNEECLRQGRIYADAILAAFHVIPKELLSDIPGEDVSSTPSSGTLPDEREALRCQALDPWARIRIQCVLDTGHEGRHLDAFGEDFAAGDQEIGAQDA